MTSNLEKFVAISTGRPAQSYDFDGSGVTTVSDVANYTAATGDMSYWAPFTTKPVGSNSGLGNLPNPALAEIGQQINSYGAQLAQLQQYLAMSGQQQDQPAYGAMPAFAQMGNLPMGNPALNLPLASDNPAFMTSEQLLENAGGGISLNEIVAKLTDLEAQQAAQPTLAQSSPISTGGYSSSSDDVLAQQIEAFNALTTEQPSAAGGVMSFEEQQLAFAQLGSSTGTFNASAGISGSSKARVPASQLSMSNEGRDYLKSFEALKLKAYQDSVGVWTIGWGHTGSVNGKAVTPGMTINEAEAERLFSQDLAHFEKAIKEALGNTEVTPAEFDMIVSLAFNAGAESVANSTLVKKLKAGDREGAAKEFANWNKAGGSVLQGLTNRRTEEASIFRNGYTTG